MSTNAAPSRSNRLPLVIVGLLLLGGLGYLGWRFWPAKKADEKPTHGPVPIEAINANLRGVGHMDKNEKAEAVAAFEEADRLAPGCWLPAKINLAIALLNFNDDSRPRAHEILTDIIETEPENPHAHYCLAMLEYHRGELAACYKHLEIVAKVDPNDAHTWYFLGMSHPKGRDSAEAKECFERALKLNPYLNAARYNLAQHPIGRSPERTKQLLDEKEALDQAKWQTSADVKYTKMGPYAELIGRFPSSEKVPIGPLPLFIAWDKFQVKLAEGTTWSRPADFGTGTVADLHRAVRARFGATMIVFDYNGDGKTDIFLAGAVTRKGKVGDLLLRNDGNGVFADVTSEAGLADGWSLGVSAADYDNDGRPDLLLTGIGAPRLFRNLGNGKFDNVSQTAGFNDKDFTGVFLGSAWIDIDQDGDVDVLLARYADSAEAALARLQGKDSAAGGFVLMLNTGEATPGPGNTRLELTTAFKRWSGPGQFSGAAVAVAFADFDADRDIDLLLLADGKSPGGLWNDRLLRFREANELAESGNWNGALVLDVNHDQRSDVLTLPTGKPPLLWLSKPALTPNRLDDCFKKTAVDSPVLLQAQAIDLDRDGWTDIVGLSADHRPVFLHNDGTGKLVRHPDAFGPPEDMKDIQAALAADLDGDAAPDLLLWSENKGLQVLRNSGNGNRTLRIAVTGQRDSQAERRTNADGTGAWVVAQSGTFWTGLEKTVLQAGLGQSLLPVELGLGNNAQADVVHIRWPDGVRQAEMAMAAGASVRVSETDRRDNSCPVLFAWNGERFRYVTDFLGAGSMGELNPDGSTRPPRPEESVKLEPGALAAQNGWYRIKIAQPMNEVAYLDHLQLVVIDHPDEWNVYPDERFVFDKPQPTQELLFLTDLRSASQARDHRGRDVTALLRERDRRMVDGFNIRSWLGYAEEHSVELTWDAADARKAKDSRWVLCLHGWTAYPYPESIWAAQQAGVELTPPILETPATEGIWRSCGELGFPAGLPRTMTRDVTGALDGAGRCRIRTNMQVYWDQILLGRRISDAEARAASNINSLPVSKATLRRRGFAQEMSPDGKKPVVYDDQRTEPVPVTEWKGRLTRLGDVTELLTAQDDRFVICGPGEEIEIAFDASHLPPPAPNRVRSFVLRTAGYSKDTAPFTKTGGSVGPLPYRSMPNYPPPTPPKEIAPALEEYDRRWNTRGRE